MCDLTGQQDLRGAECAEAELGGGETRGHVLGDLGDLLLQFGGGAGELGDPLAEPDQGLVQDPGLAVSAFRAGQRRAGACPALAREGTDLLA